MLALLRESLAQGALGFSSTRSPTHNDGDGAPVPSRHASREELIALARAVRDFPGTTVEFLPGIGEFSDEQKQLLTDLSLAANRPVNWNVLAPSAANPRLVEAQLSASDFARAQGAEVVALTVPQAMSVRINLHSGFIFDALYGWAELFRKPVAERMAFLREPANRARLEAGARDERSGLLRGLAVWENLTIDQVHSAGNERYLGRRVGDVARELGVRPFDAMLEVALADDLHTSFMPPSSGDDEATWKLRGRTWTDDRTVIGASDAGAHLDMIDTFAFSTQVLGKGVRKHGLLTVEEAVRQLSDVPARLYGLRQRGRLELGWHADVVVFDEGAVECGPTYTRFDLPAGAGRLYADALGIDHVLVNGVEVVRGREDTGRRPGTIFRSGRDSETVTVPGGGV
jgi:N-acyl-D-aspartate/D-glutamate deacylase